MWNARLQLRKVEWYWVRWANRSAIHSSVRARSAEKYSGMPGVWASTPRNAASNASLLEYWWLTDWSSVWTVGTEADHSLDMTTASRSSSVAASTAMAEMIPVTGTWPFRKPSSRDRSSCGSISRPARTTGSPVTAAGRSIASNRAPGRLTTNSAMSAIGRTSSTVTIESMPPPNGTRARRGASVAGGVAGVGGVGVVGGLGGV